MQYILSLQGSSPTEKHASKAQEVHFNSLLSLVEQLLACPTPRRILTACKREDVAPTRPVSLCRASSPHKLLLQDFRMELEVSLKISWRHYASTAALPKSKPCGPGSSSRLYSSNALWHYWKNKPLASQPKKEGFPPHPCPIPEQPSSWPGWAAAGPLARLLGRVRETAARHTSCHFFLPRTLAIFSQLFCAADVTRQ